MSTDVPNPDAPGSEQPEPEFTRFPDLASRALGGSVVWANDDVFAEIVADGDIVMVHSRHNLLTPEMMVAVNIFRVKDGRLVEHWEVMQPEVAETVSGNPMFTPA